MNEVPSCTCSCAQSEISGHEPSSQSIQELEHKLSRRNALVAGATATAGALALSACAEGSSGGGGGGGNGAAGPESPTDIAAVSEVPVGKAAKLTKGGVTVIVSQPEDGVFKAFSSTCTHQGCQLNVQNNSQIVCPCHGSQFALADGSVKGGPAESPLKPYKAEVKDGRIIVGG